MAKKQKQKQIELTKFRMIKDMPEITERDLQLAGVQILAKDFDLALNKAHETQADSIGAAKVNSIFSTAHKGKEDPKIDQHPSFLPFFLPSFSILR
jgi:3-hydroxyisobutyrate dehydrogenase-like beta-hydroxyacid dehydrogenase